MRTVNSRSAVRTTGRSVKPKKSTVKKNHGPPTLEEWLTLIVTVYLFAHGG